MRAQHATVPPAGRHHPQNRTTSESSAKNRSAAALTTTTPTMEIIMAVTILNAPAEQASGPTTTHPDYWRSIPNWPEYQVSREGEVRRIGPAAGAVIGRILRPQQNQTTKYYGVSLSRHSKQRRVDIHRLVAIAFLGPQPSPKHVVAHNDGSRTNNRFDNIRWATQRENLTDCRKHGTSLQGSANPGARLDEIDVSAIRRMKQVGIPRLVIADGFGVHLRTVLRVLSGTSWGHVQ